MDNSSNLPDIISKEKVTNEGKGMILQMRVEKYCWLLARIYVIGFRYVCLADKISTCQKFQLMKNSTEQNSVFTKAMITAQKCKVYKNKTSML